MEKYDDKNHVKRICSRELRSIKKELSFMLANLYINKYTSIWVSVPNKCVPRTTNFSNKASWVAVWLECWLWGSGGSRFEPRSWQLVKVIGEISGPWKIVYDWWYKNRQKSVSFSGHIPDNYRGVDKSQATPVSYTHLTLPTIYSV